MFLKEFIEMNETTRDTVYFYIEQKLLQPQKANGKYNFSAQDVTDFESIRDLRNIGFSIEQIQQIAEQRKRSKGTKEHWELSLMIIEKQLEYIKRERALFDEQEVTLLENKTELLKRLKGIEQNEVHD